MVLENQNGWNWCKMTPTNQSQHFWVKAMEITERVSETIETMVCELYGTNKTSITEARYKKFCKNSMLHLCLLPPMKGELKLHMKRANYQAFGKKQWKENQTYLPQVVTVGCKTWIPRSCVDNGKLQSQSWSW